MEQNTLTVEEEVYRVIKFVLGLDGEEHNFRPSANLVEDLGADSLSLEEIKLELEATFKCGSIPSENWTPEKLAYWVERHNKRKSAVTAI